MLMSPVPMVADTYVAHQRLTLRLDDRNGESERAIGTVYPATIPKRLLREVVAHLKPHLVGTIVSTIVRNRGEIAARQKHYLMLSTSENRRFHRI